ncbi:hypothetical protein BDZ45DRAFT_736746 [Acephala macrosclerotiorum]|nr:hypothetical protein BDZ45DRAFT_736746 [Acephala macrosclerotiorum]
MNLRGEGTEDKGQSFEQIIRFDQTIQYTLAPHAWQSLGIPRHSKSLDWCNWYPSAVEDRAELNQHEPSFASGTAPLLPPTFGNSCVNIGQVRGIADPQQVTV